MIRRLTLLLILLTALAGLLPLAAQAKASPVGSVRYIHRGLAVQPPHHRAAHGKVKQKLYAAYHLATTRSQLASLSFKDGSTLHINENTDLTLRSPHATYVRKGEVDVIDNGGHHQVVTAVATVSAIGTEYDVKVIVSGGKVTVIVTVASGTVMVTSRQGTQQVTPGQQVTVTSDGTISQPVSVDAASVVAWTSILPAPPASSSPTPTATGTSAAPTPTPTSTPVPSPTATPTNAPPALFTYSFTGLSASWTAPSPPGGIDGTTVTQATGCGTTSSAVFSIVITATGHNAAAPVTIHPTWVFANTLQTGGHRYVNNGTVEGEIDLFLTMHGADTSAPTVTMAPQIQGNITGYTPGTVSVPVTRTPVASCP